MRLGCLLRAGDVVALSGDLGAGKTCFVQGIAEGLGVRGPVTSPSFVLIAEHEGRLRLYHVDLYRLEDVEAIRALGLEELLGSDGVTVIEWGERAAPLLPAGTLRVRITFAGETAREVEFEGLPEGWAAALAP